MDSRKYVSHPNRSQVGPYRQSERGEIYKEMADKLVQDGWAYPCFCTEEELIAKREQVGQLEGESEAATEVVKFPSPRRTLPTFLPCALTSSSRCPF